MIVVASGGMYTQPLDVAVLDPDAAAYDGTKAYARCKRAQVVLAEEWTRELLDTGITVNAMHPGWADTPGASGPRFPASPASSGPLLRTPEEGADTIVWLAAAPEAAGPSGLFFLDRRAAGETSPAPHPSARRGPRGGETLAALYKRTAPFAADAGGSAA